MPSSSAKQMRIVGSSWRLVVGEYWTTTRTDRSPRRKRDAKLIDIGDQLARLDATEQVVTLPPDIDWSWEPKANNGVLRAMWDHMDLGPDMYPICAEWRVPEWRT